MNPNTKKATATCYNLYSVAASKHDSYACGNGFEPNDGQYLDRLYNTDRDLNLQRESMSYNQVRVYTQHLFLLLHAQRICTCPQYIKPEYLLVPEKTDKIQGKIYLYSRRYKQYNISYGQLLLKDSVLYPILLSCQSSVTVTSCFVYKFIRDL